MSSVDALFHQKLTVKVRDSWQAKSDELEAGYIGEPGLVAMNYRATVGYIRALRDVLDMCEQVEQELMGGSA